jgi:hypothetical protein
MKLQRLQNKVLYIKFPGSTPICDMHISFQIPQCTITYPNYAGNKSKSFEIMTIYMFTILDKVKSDIENVRGLNLTVRHVCSCDLTAVVVGANFGRE